MNKETYTQVNAQVIDCWARNGWKWAAPIDHETFLKARQGQWDVLLTPTKPVPHDWFCPLTGARILGLASGGGQQMPVFSALGAECTVLDYSAVQLQREEEVAAREGYALSCVRADMTKPLPFADGCFDLIFHPVSNSYVKDVLPIWRECFRVLRPGGILLAGVDTGINYLFDDDEKELEFPLPFDPLADEKLYERSLENDWGIQFSHTVEEQLGGQLAAGFQLTHIFHDTNGSGRLHEFNVPTFYATRAVKPER